MSNTIRITGMATGLDVDTLVKQMMKAESTRVDSIKQNRQIVQWKQDIYREYIGDINTFKSTYFDVLKTDSYMLSANNYAGFDVTSVDSQSSGISPTSTASAGAGAAAGEYKVVVKQIAKSAMISGTSLTNNQAVVDLDYSKWSNQKISVSIDNGTSIDINIPDYSSMTGILTLDMFASDIQQQITSNTKLNGKISVSTVDGNKLQFNTLSSSTIKITNAPSDIFSGIKLNSAINPTGSTKLSDIGLSDSSTFNITYNGIVKPITINADDTINSFLTAVSTVTSNNVTAKFSQLTGKITLQTTNTGSSNSISIDNSILGMSSGSGTPGQDAVVKIVPPGGVETTITKSANSFLLDGVAYTLQSADETRTSKITVSANIQKTYDKIKAFVDKYNEMIDKIKTRLDEKKDYNYKPLTDDQKKDMSEDDIKKWEEKCKQGILKGDSELQNMLYSLRRSFYDSVKGSGISLKDVGLSTDSDYTEGGKIVINEAKLKDAILNRGNQVANLFMKDSSISYDPDHKSDSGRYESIGIFQRINDIFKDYTRTSRNSNNKKGILIEKAGIKGDVSEFNNTLTNDITNNYNKRITELMNKLADKEDKYYLQFSKLETAMQKMNTQSSWLAQQLGTTGGS